MAGKPPNPDIRWKQRLQSFQKAFGQLRAAVELTGQKDLSELERQGLIKAFELTYELAWKTLKDYLEDQGETRLGGPKDVIRKAFKLELIGDGETWMEMIQSRNRSIHSYNEQMAAEIVKQVVADYFRAFEIFETSFVSREKEAA